MKSQKVYKYFKKNGALFFIFKAENDKYLLVKSTPIYYKHSISNVYYTNAIHLREWNCELCYMNPYTDTYNSKLVAHQELIDNADLCLLLME